MPGPLTLVTLLLPVVEDVAVHVPVARKCTSLFLIFLGCGAFSLSSQITLESLCYVAIACLYAFTPSSRKERTLSGIFLSLLAVVVVLSAANDKRSNATVALAVYCKWKLRSRCCTEAPAADAEVPLAPVQEEARCAPVQQAMLHLHNEDLPRCSSTPVQVQQTTIHIEQLPRKFTYNEIRAVTGDFGTMVGRGGSAEVYRGLLDDGRAVAVKRITSDKPVGETDFLREISIVANVHHRSLVRLLGYCVLRGGSSQYHLVYPFFENGSLDWWLFHGEERRRLLPWPTRRRIAVDVARLLAYLHHECHLQILHLDIKPANILLRAHVSDFGISMSIAQDGRSTVGYMAPEMLVSSLSAKSDVYSYGMMLLELVVGRRSVDPGSAASSETADLFARVVRDKMVRGELVELVDTAMAHVDVREVKVALCCVQHSRDVIRPSMLTVLDMIEGRVAVDLPLGTSVSVADFMEPLSSPVARYR
ncbi:probable receptor-like protein kinase At5g20050 isoform X1 [Miscanthus floridulus]|uniref:probable receptor-like protein kinase At5g20050 isoform X1 n=1 Tax=Miscanthus floridulus TaxID=154761 RepID=UPI00345B2819